MRYAKSALKKRPARAKRVYRKRAPRASKTLVKTIQSVIHRNTENKQSWLTYPLASFNSAADASSDILNCLPPTQQGTAENQRIGDDIRAQKLTIQGHMIGLLSGSYTRIGVRMLICQPKLTTSNTLVNATAAQWLPNVLRIGGSNMGLNGTIESLYAPVDTDVVTCYYDKVFYISQPTIFTTVGAAETTHTTKFFKVNLKMKNKLLKYNSGFSSGNYPINYSPSILFSYVFLNGAAPVSGLDFNQMSFTFTSLLEYEDA